MNSRQRVLSALDHEEPDRVPVDFGGHRSSGIMATAYRGLRKHLGFPEVPTRVYDLIQQLAIIDDDILERFGVDTTELGRGFSREDRFWKPWRLPDGADCLIPAWHDVRRVGNDEVLFAPTGRSVGVMKAGSLYFTQNHWPYLNGVPGDLSGLPEAMSEVMWAMPCPPEPGADLEAGARALRSSTDRAIVFIFGGNLLEWGQFLCRNDGFLLLLASDPAAAHRLLDRLTEIHLIRLERARGRRPLRGHRAFRRRPRHADRTANISAHVS